MRNLVTLIAGLAMLAGLAGCGSSAASADSASSADSSRCVDVPAGRLSALTDGTDIKPVKSAAVKSGDFKHVYMVAVKFTLTGDDDAGQHTGVWATAGLKADAAGYFAVDGFARQFSDWPASDTGGKVNITQADDGVDAARACVQ